MILSRSSVELLAPAGNWEALEAAAAEGRCLVIRPQSALPIGHVSHNPDEMRHVYEQGREAGLRYLDRLRDFYGK